MPNFVKLDLVQVDLYDAFFLSLEYEILNEKRNLLYAVGFRKLSKHAYALTPLTDPRRLTS